MAMAGDNQLVCSSCFQRPSSYYQTPAIAQSDDAAEQFRRT